MPNRPVLRGVHLFNWIDRARAGTLGRRGQKRGSAERCSSRRAERDDTEREFIDLGVFTHEEMADAFNGGCLLEVDLPARLRMRVPISVDPDLLTRAVRALKVA